MDLSRIPPAPRDPTPRARELVFGYQGSQRILLMVGLVFAAVGLILAIPFCWGMPSDVAILAGGRAQHGRVISAEVDGSVTINDRHPTVIRFDYAVNGQRYRGQSSTLNGALIAGARPEASIPIEVSNLNPEWARVTGSTRSPFGYGAALVLIFPLLGLVMAGFAVRSNRREKRAWINGEAAAAKVVYAGFDYSTTLNGRHPWQIKWEFSVADRIFSGSLSSMSQLALQDLGKAPEIAVLYDPADPGVNTAWVD